jgi:hypothetical protein
MDHRHPISLFFITVIVFLLVIFGVIIFKNDSYREDLDFVESSTISGNGLKSENGRKYNYYGGDGESFPTETSCNVEGHTWSSGECHCKTGKTGSLCDQDLSKNDFQPVSMSTPKNGSLVEMVNVSVLEFPLDTNTALEKSRSDDSSIGVTIENGKYFSIISTNKEIINFNSLIPTDSAPNGWIKTSVYKEYGVYDGKFLAYNSVADLTDWWLKDGGGSEKFTTFTEGVIHLFEGPWKINTISPPKDVSIFVISPPAPSATIKMLTGLTKDEVAKKFRDGSILNGKEVVKDKVHLEVAPFNIIIFEPVVVPKLGRKGRLVVTSN